MKRFAILCGSASTDFQQKKISLMHEKLIAEGWAEKEITVFVNGASELLLEYSLNNCIAQKAEKIFLYFCMKSEADNKQDSFFLGTEEIRKDVIAQYDTLFERNNIEKRIVYDYCSEFECAE